MYDVVYRMLFCQPLEKKRKSSCTLCGTEYTSVPDAAYTVFKSGPGQRKYEIRILLCFCPGVFTCMPCYGTHHIRGSQQTAFEYYVHADWYRSLYHFKTVIQQSGSSVYYCVNVTYNFAFHSLSVIPD